jgi:phosphoribosylanthranilate isomerase
MVDVNKRALLPFLGRRSMAMGEKQFPRMLGCTLNGVDESVAPEALVKLANRYKFAEFGLAWSEESAGTGPYASEEYIETILGMTPLKGRLALHVCHYDAIENLLCNRESVVKDIASLFRRVQLNLTSYDRTSDLEFLINLCGRLCDGEDSLTQTVIVPYNAETLALAEDMADIPHLAILFDTSAGRGITPAEWPPAFAGIDCGYAGGLKPENLERELLRIHLAASQVQGGGYWVDMESGLRDPATNCFSLAKAETALKIVERFRNSLAYQSPAPGHLILPTA